MDLADGSIRQKALDRLAALSSKTSSQFRGTDSAVDGRSVQDPKDATAAAQDLRSMPNGVDPDAESSILAEMDGILAEEDDVATEETEEVLCRAVRLLCTSKKTHSALVRQLVAIPFRTFTEASINQGIEFWIRVMHENPSMEPQVLTEICQAWERTVDHRIGIFSLLIHRPDPFYLEQEFAPSDKEDLAQQQQLVQSTISPHLKVLRFFANRFDAIRRGSVNTQRTFLRLIRKTLDGLKRALHHPLARGFHFNVVLLGLQTLRLDIGLSMIALWQLHDQIISTGLSWFKSKPMWSFGSNRDPVKADIKILSEVLSTMNMTDHIGMKATKIHRSLQPKQDLFRRLVENERNRLSAWLCPLERDRGHHAAKETLPSPLVNVAWSADPSIAIQLATRFHSETLRQVIRFHLVKFSDKCVADPDALDLLLGQSLPSDITYQLKYLLYWAPVNPMQAVTYLLPAYGNHPLVLQYAMRALGHHPAEVTFFYVPQIVQCLRYDALGYIQRYIVETGTSSQLFAHQIIWNIKANAYKDEDSQVPDPVKPTLDKVMESLVSRFSDEDREFYEREFSFFGEVTSISGKLKPLIKKSKPEKKAKIDKELEKIEIQVGVYLPSNPNGVVVGIDRTSGRPLQSHAKAPFMATFQIQKFHQQAEAGESPENPTETVCKSPTREKVAHQEQGSTIESVGQVHPAESHEVWQSAIFKVGDDCRQDVLALQMIAVFRGIFNSCGLDVYVYPYRVTATAPGCGVIDVLPNSVSRDTLGREGVPGLYEYFISKYGNPDTARYQEAQANFIKSMAAYSVISYLLQLKDRHNGNVMFDDAGHILHIDFGFCFDIAPGGVKFERAPFRLTPEMMAVMGKNSPNGQTYLWFEELTIQSFLASRPYMKELSHLVTLMLDSGLPCFRPETMRNFKDRFVLEKTERGAAEFMKACIRKSEANYSTKLYDEFQLRTNGIPY